MRGLVPHEFAENTLALSIMDVRKHMRAIAGDPIASTLLREDLALLTRTVDEISKMAGVAA